MKTLLKIIIFLQFFIWITFNVKSEELDFQRSYYQFVLWDKLPKNPNILEEKYSPEQLKSIPWIQKIFSLIQYNNIKIEKYILTYDELKKYNQLFMIFYYYYEKNGKTFDFNSYIIHNIQNNSFDPLIMTDEECLFFFLNIYYDEIFKKINEDTKINFQGPWEFTSIIKESNEYFESIEILSPKEKKYFQDFYNTVNLISLSYLFKDHLTTMEIEFLLSHYVSEIMENNKNSNYEKFNKFFNKYKNNIIFKKKFAMLKDVFHYIMVLNNKNQEEIMEIKDKLQRKFSEDFQLTKKEQKKLGLYNYCLYFNDVKNIIYFFFEDFLDEEEISVMANYFDGKSEDQIKYYKKKITILMNRYKNNTFFNKNFKNIQVFFQINTSYNKLIKKQYKNHNKLIMKYVNKFHIKDEEKDALKKCGDSCYNLYQTLDMVFADVLRDKNDQYSPIRYKYLLVFYLLLNENNYPYKPHDNIMDILLEKYKNDELIHQKLIFFKNFISYKSLLCKEGMKEIHKIDKDIYLFQKKQFFNELSEILQIKKEKIYGNFIDFDGKFSCILLYNYNDIFGDDFFHELDPYIKLRNFIINYDMRASYLFQFSQKLINIL